MNLLPAAWDLPEPIRPRHCDCAGCNRNFGTTVPDSLYPDPPDWWFTESEVEGQLSNRFEERSWQYFMRDVWRVLRVVEDGE